MKIVKTSFLVPLVLFMALGLNAWAQVTPLDAGPPDAVSNFPVTMGDGTNVLVLCLDSPNCLPAPPIAGNQLSENVGFGATASWFSANALITLPGGGRAIYTAAVEASWATGVPVAGDQLPVMSITIRMDVPVGGEGTYTFFHPYGTETVNVLAAGDRAIDIVVPPFEFPGVFNAAVTGLVGPFLTAVQPPAPAGFIGNPNVDQTVTGSPNGDNLFQIDGPVGVDLDGLGNNTVSTNLFAIEGRLLPAVVTPLTAAPATPVTLVSGQTQAVTITGGQGGITAASSNALVATATVTGRTVHVQGGTNGGTATITVSDSLVPATTATITATTTAATVVGQAGGLNTQTVLPTASMSLLLNITPRAGTTPAQIAQEWLVIADFGPTGQIPNGIFFLTSAGTLAPLSVATANPGSATFTFNHALTTHFIGNLSLGALGFDPGATLMYGYAYSTTPVTDFGNAPNLVLDNLVTINVQ